MLAKHTIGFALLASIPLADRLGEAASLLVVPVSAALLAAGDAAFGRAPADGAAAAKRGLAPRAIPWTYIPLQIAVIAWGLAEAAGGATPLRLGALAVAIGFVGGIFGMLSAHEMIHSRRAAERALGAAMLAALGCLHFRIAHLRLHHRLAATATDPATARCGESLYRFILRSVSGQWRGAWVVEHRRRAPTKRFPGKRLPAKRFPAMRFPALANRVARDAALMLAIYGAIGATLGLGALVFQLLQGAVAVVILEAFNYVAHYGLERRTLPGGRHEALSPRHSWNTAHRFNNWALFNGGHHSDHHCAPSRPYHALRPLPETPMLPFGYAGTMLLALVPPLWRRVMDPRVAALSRGGEPAARLAEQPERDRGVEDVPRDAVAEGGLV